MKMQIIGERLAALMLQKRAEWAQGILAQLETDSTGRVVMPEELFNELIELAAMKYINASKAERIRCRMAAIDVFNTLGRKQDGDDLYNLMLN